MKIWLIRHGRTAANERHIYCGSTDLPLSEGGRSDLRNVNYNVSGARFVTSGMRRTNETLELLFGHIPYETDRRFREMDFGAFEMHSYEMLKDRPDYQAWLAGNNEANLPPGGESGQQMQRRVLEALFLLRGDTVVVTHGGCIAAAMAFLFPEEGKNRYQWQPEPGGGYLLEGKFLENHMHTFVWKRLNP